MPNTTSLVLQDNGYGTIGAALATGDTTLTFTTGHGSRFPAVASGQVLMCCILNSGNVLQEVLITLHSAGSDSATMVRGQNGTTAKAWNAGDRIEARVSSEVLKRLQVEALKEISLTTADSGATFTGSISPTGYGLVSGLVYSLKTATSNIGTAPTINLSSLGAVTVVLDGGGALVIGAMPVNGLYKYDGTNFLLLNPKINKQPTRQVFTSGSGTYTTPTGATRINVRMVGAGGTGGPGGGAGAANGGPGTASTFSTLSAGGGAAGAQSGNATGGAVSGGDINLVGGGGGGASTNGTSGTDGGAMGGAGPFGGAGAGGPLGNAGAAGAANTGGGGGGGGTAQASGNNGGGGGAGGYVEKLITAPAATYSYSVGAAGSASTAGASGGAGGLGGTGLIIVDEWFN